MNEITKYIKRKHGYKLGTRKINIFCYADNTVFIIDNGNNLQRIL
jgi:hypothetical protein